MEGLEEKDKLMYKKFSDLLDEDPKQAYEFFMENPQLVHCCYVGEVPAIYHQLREVGLSAADSFRNHVARVLEDCLMISNLSEFIQLGIESGLINPDTNGENRKK